MSTTSLPGVSLPIPWWWLPVTLAAVGAFVYLPGYLLAVLVHRKRPDPIVLLADVPVFGLVFFSCFALAAYLLALRWALLIGALGLGIVALAVTYWRRRAQWAPGADDREADRWLIGLTAAASVCLAVLSWGTQWVEVGDSAIHLQIMTGMAHRAVVAQPTYALLRGVPSWDRAYDAYYPLLVLLSKATHLQLYEVWRVLSGIWALSVPFATVALARELSRSRAFAGWVAMMTVLVPLFAEPVLWGTLVGTLVYPNRVYLWVLMPVALRFAITALRTGERRAAVTAASIVAAMVLVHQEGLLVFGVTLLAYGLLLAPLGRQRAAERAKRTLLQVALVGAFSLPLLALKWPYSREYVQLCSHEAFYSYYHLAGPSGSLYAFPFPSEESWTVFALGASCAIASAMLVVRGAGRLRAAEPVAPGDGSVYEAGLFAAASFIGPLLTRQNPLVVPWLGKLISYVAVGRLIRGGQAVLLFAFLAWGTAYAIGLAMRRGGVARSTSVAAANAAVAVAAVAALIGCGYHAAASTPRADWTVRQPALVKVGRLLAPGSVVLAPKQTATAVVEFAPVRVPTFRFNGPIDLVGLSEENEAMARFFSSSISNEGRSRIAAKYNAAYALLDRRQSTLDPAEFRGLGQVLYEDDSYTLIRLRD